MTCQIRDTYTIAFLQHMDQQNKKISELTDSLPARFTANNRIKEFPTNAAKECIAQLIGNNDALSYQAIEAAFGELCGKVENTDLTDGLRITFQNGEIIHLRPSGNAPEFRCYNEADSLSHGLRVWLLTDRIPLVEKLMRLNKYG